VYKIHFVTFFSVHVLQLHYLLPRVTISRTNGFDTNTSITGLPCHYPHTI